MITLSIMLATIIQAIDGTIANVALPHMQGNLSASLDQITWVLTSYIVAAGIATPLAGWRNDQFGLKKVLLVSISVVTVASVLCGAADSLFRSFSPAAPGFVRRCARSALPGSAAGCGSAKTARPRHGHVGRRGHDRTDPGSGPWGLADGELELAVGVLH
jgi:MFS family permease